MDTSALGRGIDQLGTLLAAVTPDDADRSTPCSEWTVADLSDHVVNSITGMTAMAKGEEPDWSSSPHHDDPLAAFRARADDLLEAAAASGGAFPDGLACAELAVHGYDLAVALGRGTGDLDVEVAEAGYAFMSSSLTDDQRGGAFGPEQPAPPDADPYQRLAAFAGRTV